MAFQKNPLAIKGMAPASRDARMYYGWAITAASFLLMVIFFGTRHSFGVFFKSLGNDFGLTRGGTSAIFSIYMLLCCVFSILGGRIYDRYGPRMMTFVMGTVTSISLLLTSRATSEGQLLITYSMLLAMGTGAAYPVTTSLTSRWFVRKRGLALGITTSGSGLGALMVPPFVTHLIAAYNWRAAMVIMALLAWPAVASISFLLRRDPRQMGLLPDGIKDSKDSETLGVESSQSAPSGLSLVQAIRKDSFWSLAMVWFSLSLSVHLIIVHIVPYALDLGIPSMDAALIVGFIGGAAIPGRIAIGKFSDLAGRKPLAMVCALVQALSFLWLMEAKDIGALYAFAIAFGFSWGGMSTIITAFIGDFFGMQSIGIIMGVMSAFWSIGAALGPFMAGAIFDHLGTYSMAFKICSVLMFTTMFLLIVVRRPGGKGKP